MVIGGLALLAAGGITYGIKSSEVQEQGEIPVVQEYNQARTEIGRARGVLNSSQNFVPQHLRTDYSPAQAHSRAERAYQTLHSSEWTVGNLQDNPLVTEYTGDEVIAFVGLLGAALGVGLIFRGLD